MIRTIGIVGGGQLARMLTQAVKRLGFEVVVIDPTPDCPAAQVGAKQIVAEQTNAKAIQQLSKQCDVLTIDVEHVDADTLEELAQRGAQIHPAPSTIQLIQDKLRQKEKLSAAGLPVALFSDVTKQSFQELAQQLGKPFHLKARRGAFDGRGNRVIKTAKDFANAKRALSAQALYAEQHVSFVKELSVVLARDTSGTFAVYPVVETVHVENICREVYSPAPVDQAVTRQAAAVASRAVDQFSGAGVFAVELFMDRAKGIIINEIAPRVHNSGHHTVEGNITSQFEQHIRAITGLPLGETGLRAPATAMVNILGETNQPMHNKGIGAALATKGVHLHLYGKTPVRKQRKMGHITACANSLAPAKRRARQARKALDI